MSGIDRFADRAVAEPGTPIETWLPWVRALPPVEAGEFADRPLCVVAPHPDDEVLGVGALTAYLTDRAVPVSIVAVTDGDASHPGSPTRTPAELVALRRRESDTAARELGVGRIIRLGLPDGAVRAHEQRLTELLLGHVTAGATVAIPLREDGHPDHEATARAAATAARERGARVIEYPIWMWHWSFPGDPAVDWTRARRLEIPAAYADRKRRAAAAFVSQLCPLSDHPADRAVLPPHVIDRLLGLGEVVLI